MATTPEGSIPRRPAWRDAASYEYTRDLTREGWAWEFLRRNPTYRVAWSEQAERVEITPRSLTSNVTVIAPPVTSLCGSRNWGLVVFEDPDRTAADACAFWLPEVCSSVLPVHATALSDACSAPLLDLLALRCKVILVEGMDDGQHVLFVDGSRRLQLLVAGSDIRGRPRLLTDALLAPSLLGRRFRLLAQLSGLATRRSLAPQLHAPEPRAERLRFVLRALDGYLDGASQRDIAAALFAASRVQADWPGPVGTLRDKIRRALRRGRSLMKAGYLKLLK